MIRTASFAGPWRCRARPLMLSGRHPQLMSNSTTFRQQLARLLAWEDAHAGFDKAVHGLPAAARGTAPAGLPYSPWQLVEHMRLTQADILDFCVAARYDEKEWPRDYWPAAPAPPSISAWDQSLQGFRRDRDAMIALALDDAVDLDAPVPNGTGQTYLRELLLVADHTAYHVGELIVVRRLLGAWTH